MSEHTEVDLTEHAMFDTAWRLLRSLNVDTIVVSFSGSGDEGDINDVSYQVRKSEDGQPLMQPTFDPEVAIAVDKCDTGLPSMNTYHHDDGDDDKPAPTLKLNTLVDELTRSILDNAEIPDWVNDEGGYGEVTWHVSDEPPHISVECNIRVVESELHSFAYTKFGERDEANE